jgi:hypothetical protein
MREFRKYREVCVGGTVTASQHTYWESRKIRIEPVDNLTPYKLKELVAAVERAKAALDA